MSSLYSPCRLCPRECGADRTTSFGICRENDVARIAWCGLHRGEEGPVSGDKGSGMLFFTGCALRCPHCQNYQISLEGDEFSSAVLLDEDMACRLCRELEDMGAETISFVTADHFAPFVASVIKRLRSENFKLPFVFNTSGYMSTGTLSMLIGLVDIWLWDTKTHSRDVAERYLGAADYPDVEKRALEYLCANDEDSLIIVRHLVLPGFSEASIECIKDFEKYKDRCYFSLMSQFVSPFSPELRVSSADYDRVQKALFGTDIENGFVQDSEPDEPLWLPDFSKDNPFPDSFATPLPLFLEMRNAQAAK